MATQHTNDKGYTLWTAYCTECGERVYDTIPNGRMAQAAAERHADKTGHETLLASTYTGDEDQ